MRCVDLVDVDMLFCDMLFCMMCCVCIWRCVVFFDVEFVGFVCVCLNCDCEMKEYIIFYYGCVCDV